MARTAFAINGGTTGTTTPSITCRSGGAALAAGDLVVCFLGYDGAGTISNANGWTVLKDAPFTGATAKIAYKIATGGETAWAPTLTVSERWAAITFHWPAGEWHGTTVPVANTVATGSSTTPNPTSLTPSWGTDGGVATSYVAACFADDSTAPFPITGWPTDFSLLQTQSGGDAQTSSCDVAAAMYEASVASKDPAAFTMTSTETWAAYTVAVRGPAAAGGSVSPTLLGASSQFTPTVTPGGVSVSPALLGGGTISTPAVAMSVAVPLISQLGVVFAPAPFQFIIFFDPVTASGVAFTPAVGVQTVSIPVIAGYAGYDPGAFDPGSFDTSQLFAPVATVSGTPQSVDVGLLGGGVVFALTATPAVVVAPALLGGAAVLDITVIPAQFVTPGIIGGGLIIGPTIVTSAVTVFPDALGGAVLHAPSLSTGGVTVSPALLGASSLFTPTLGLGGLSVNPALIDRSAVLFGMSFPVGGITVGPNFIGPTGIVFAAQINLAGFVPPLIVNLGVTFPPSVSGGSITIAGLAPVAFATNLRPAGSAEAPRPVGVASHPRPESP